MKTGIILLMAVACLGIGNASAQEYKIAKSTGTLEISEVNHVTIEGSNGSEIIFTAAREDHDSDADARSKGLRAISNQGIEDNTGIGLSAVVKGDVIEVRQLKKMDGPDVTISVPKGVTVVYKHSSPYGDDVTFKNFDGKIEVSTLHNSVKIENSTGAIEVRTVHGEINVVFGAAGIKNTLRAESAHGPVDITLPLGSKVNVKAKTQFGEILVDPEFKIEIEKTGGMVKYNDGVSGKINGGGSELDLSSAHNNIYIRKK